jgi:hypothetical protein
VEESHAGDPAQTQRAPVHPDLITLAFAMRDRRLYSSVIARRLDLLSRSHAPLSSRTNV